MGREGKNISNESQGSPSFYDPSIGSLVHRVDLRENTSKRSFIPVIPKQIVSVVNALAGKALGVFLVLWRESVMQRSLTVRLTTAEVRSWGISPDQKLRALSTLQDAGLVVVQSETGKNPLVTLQVRVPPWTY
jgi:hypothetical protein